LRVLLATHFFPPAQEGGTETYTLGLAKRLRGLGHTPFVICAENWGTGKTWVPTHRETVHEDIPVRRLSWNWELAPDPFVQLYDNPLVERHIETYLRELQPDIVHVTSCYSLGAGIIHAARRAGIPVVLTLTDFGFLSPRQTLARTDGSLCRGPESALTCARCQAGESSLYRNLTRLLPPDLVGRGLARAAQWPALARQPGLRGYVGDVQKRAAFLRRAFDQVDSAIAPSGALRDIFVQNGYPAERLKVSPYGLDTAWLSHVRERASDSPLTFGYVGQIEPIKGVDVLISAFQALGESTIELKIFGGLGKNAAFAQRLQTLAGGNPRIQFMGSFDRSQVADVFSQLDCIVAPSIWFENAPVVITEAFAAAKPVICTDLSGMTELVQHEVNGLVFGIGDVEALTAALRRVSQETELLARLRRGITPVRTIEEEADALVQLYAELRSGTSKPLLTGSDGRLNPISTVGKHHPGDARTML
jgi:glycosyltransferase involved in cell wall biosynthesis